MNVIRVPRAVLRARYGKSQEGDLAVQRRPGHPDLSAYAPSEPACPRCGAVTESDGTVQDQNADDSEHL